MFHYLMQCIYALGFVLIIAPALANTEFKIITLQHRFASDLLPTIRPMVGFDGSVTGVDNQLILRAEPERMREIETTIEKLDTPRVNRRITVSHYSQLHSQSATTEASGAVRSGNVAISNTQRRQSNGGYVVIERNTGSTHQTGNQFINVLDGEQAYISSGQIVPLTQEWVIITRRYIQIERLTNWQEITTGFAVRPRTIGNQVELSITPRISNINQQGFIDFERLTTTVRVSMGEWLDIGHIMQSNDEVSGKILGLQSNSSVQNTQLRIKVD